MESLVLASSLEAPAQQYKEKIFKRQETATPGVDGWHGAVGWESHGGASSSVGAAWRGDGAGAGAGAWRQMLGVDAVTLGSVMQLVQISICYFLMMMNCIIEIFIGYSLQRKC